VGRARPGVAGEWAFGGRFRDGQGVSGVNAALGSIAADREKVAAKYDGSRARAAAGRPRSPDDRVGQLLTMARENPSWGYTRLRGALKNVGLELGRSTIAGILKEQGIEPAPIRGKTMPWKTFLKAHWARSRPRTFSAWRF